MLSGPNIVFESRISELEAQLTQAEIDLKTLSQENSENKQKLASGGWIEGNGTSSSEVFRKQIESLQRYVIIRIFYRHNFNIASSTIRYGPSLFLEKSSLLYLSRKQLALAGRTQPWAPKYMQFSARSNESGLDFP